MKGRRACGDEQAPPAESSSVTHGSASHAPRPWAGQRVGPRPAGRQLGSSCDRRDHAGQHRANGGSPGGAAR